MNSPVLRKLASGVIALLLLIYVGYQVYNANYTQVKTETATYATAQDSIQTAGTVVRKETLIKQGTPGVLAYLADSGERVAKGGLIAEIYDSAQDATVQRQVESLDREIARLKQLNDPGDTYAANPDLLDKQINLKLISLLKGIHGQDYAGLPSNRDDLLYLLNERQVVTGKPVDFSGRMSELESRKSSVSEKNGKKLGEIRSPVPGYFISGADGYEGRFDYTAALNLTVEQIKERQKEPSPVASDVAGKVCEEFDWYFACVLPPDAALKLKVGKQVEIGLPFAASKAVPAEVAAVNQPDRQSEAAVILKCTYMDASIAQIRDETVQLQIDSYSGILVSQKAIHFQKLSKTVEGEDGKTTKIEREVQGVYVLHGKAIEFVQVLPVFNSGSYVICKEISDTDKDEKDELMTKSSIQLYDEVVIEGTDLYDGKIVK